jgi:hypothetical protein
LPTMYPLTRGRSRCSIIVTRQAFRTFPHGRLITEKALLRPVGKNVDASWLSDDGEYRESRKETAGRRIMYERYQPPQFGRHATHMRDCDSQGDGNATVTVTKFYNWILSF